MPRLTPSDLVKPALLDRLTNENLARRSDGPFDRFITVSQLREHICRDLAWLLNTGNLAQVEDLSSCPHVAKSVLNYGWRDLTGANITDRDLPAIQASLRRSILAFEPRIQQQSLVVRPYQSPNGDDSASSWETLTFEIEGDLVAVTDVADPVVIHMILRAGLNLNTGQVVVHED